MIAQRVIEKISIKSSKLSLFEEKNKVRNVLKREVSRK